MSQGKRHRTEYNSETSFFQFLWALLRWWRCSPFARACRPVKFYSLFERIRAQGIWTCFKGNGIICWCPFPLPFYICSLILNSRLLRELSWSQHMPLLRGIGVGSERSDLFCFR